MLTWKGGGEKERVNVNCQDDLGNTALHYAAQSGLRKCVEYLVAHGADLFTENKEKMTACDLAVANSHHETALFLEVCTIFFFQN